MDISRHPCFNDKVRYTLRRVHLPVASRCNIQCKFCNRKFDCINESRPGVTSGVLSPYQALMYLKEVYKKRENIAVVGIAGPGDPFANPDETLETLRLVRETYPEMLLCVASNGLNVLPYINDLAWLQVSHVTITVNAITPAIGANIYAWVRYGKRVYRSEQGAEILLKNQLAAIQQLKKQNITVKVNTIIIPGINDSHIGFVAEKMAALKVDILNCIPYYRNTGTAFEHIEEPSQDMIFNVKKAAAQYLPQMNHCARCRADAAGLLGEHPDVELMHLLQQYETDDGPEKVPKQQGSARPYIAIASMEGVLVNQHLGDAARLLIYGKSDGHIALIENRKTPERGIGIKRWEKMSNILNDCRTLLVSGIGPNPKQVLTEHGIEVIVMEGVIEEAVSALFEGRNINHLIKRKRTVCGEGCSNTGGGCG